MQIVTHFWHMLAQVTVSPVINGDNNVINANKSGNNEISFTLRAKMAEFLFGTQTIVDAPRRMIRPPHRCDGIKDYRYFH